MQTLTYLKVRIVESVVVDVLEEVCQPVLPLESGIDAAGQSDPVFDGFRVPAADWRVALTVKAPVLITC